MKYCVIRVHTERWPVMPLCRLLAVQRSAGPSAVRWRLMTRRSRRGKAGRPAPAGAGGNTSLSSRSIAAHGMRSASTANGCAAR